MIGNHITHKKQFIHSLTGIRGFAALWVVYYHLRSILIEAYPDVIIFHAISATGFLGVDLFSILSGFVISYTYGEKLKEFTVGKTMRYLWLRLLRIYPMVLFMLAVFTAAFIYTRGLNSIGVLLYDRSLLLQLLMLNGWGFETQFAWNVPSWTVSAEWFCYLCFPFFAPLLARITNPLPAILSAIFTLLLVVLTLYYFNSHNMDVLLDWGLIRIGGEFFTGCLLYRAYRAGWGRGLAWDIIGTASLIGIAIVIMKSQFATYLVILLFAVLIYSLAHNTKFLNRIFANRVSLYLGEISYSIYMVHWFIIIELPKMTEGVISAVHSAHLIWILIALTIAISSVTNYAVERPTRYYLRNLFSSSNT